MDFKLIKVEGSKSFLCLQRHAMDELQAQDVFAILAKDLEKINLEGYKGKSIHIQLEDDHLILKQAYKLSTLEKASVQACC
uniref:Uncharacterized protein n=1 Tax=Physcomitrium patens TaxID=3218 RepID=A0A2K1KKP3_PHYPA|nr:hypothetical protein PHYPA_008010 [Physcomitrium patens]